MATLKLGLDVNDKKLQELTKKRYKVQMDVVPKKTATAISAEETARKISQPSFQKQLQNLGKNINRVLSSDVIQNIKAGLKISSGLLIGGIVSGVGLLANTLRRSFEIALPRAEALRKLYGNLPDVLMPFSESVRYAVEDIAVQFGVNAETIASAVEATLPTMREKTLQNIKRYGEVFAKLFYLEGLSPENFLNIANVSRITGRDIEEVAQLYNIFTDSVGQSAEQIARELKKLTDDFQGNIELMFATIETVTQNITIDPRETVSLIQNNLKEVWKYISGALPFEKLSEEAKRLATVFTLPDFQQAYQKYLYQRGELTKSFEQLIKTPAVQLEQFFAKQRETLRAEMYELATTRRPAFEKIYEDINKFTKTYFGDWAPVMKSVFISPETGAPTFATAVIPVIEKLTGTNNLLQSILEAINTGVKQLMAISDKQQFGTNLEWWSKWLQDFMNANKNVFKYYGTQTMMYIP